MKIILQSLLSLCLFLVSVVHSVRVSIKDLDFPRILDMGRDLECPRLNTIPGFFGNVLKKTYEREDDRLFPLPFRTFNEGMHARITKDGRIQVHWKKLVRKEAMIQFQLRKAGIIRKVITSEMTSFAIEISDLKLEPEIWYAAYGTRNEKLQILIVAAAEDDNEVLAYVEVPNRDILSYLYKRFLGEKEKCDKQVQKDVSTHVDTFYNYEQPLNDNY